MNTSRREFLTLLGAAGAAAAVAPSSLFAAPKVEPFSFVFITDAHIQPELNAAMGTDMAMKKARTFKADFAINGGDHVFDSLGVPKARALQLFDLYDKTEQDLGLKVHHTIGNHDVFGIYPVSGVSPTDPLYGKKIFEDRFGKRFYTFDHKGVHFIVLDSIGITSDRMYEGRIDAEQMEWLKADLAALPKGTPIIISVHIPLVSAFASYIPMPMTPAKHQSLTVGNANEVVDLLDGHNVLGVLQGHTHINENVEYKGIPYITSGAVCGNWWKGVRMGTPEGFTVVTVAGGKMTTHYETYGFKAVGA
ncbi:MAG: metallophosphoesterase [Edaphobacter sp.]|uniref:metallophosphoesterase family protein n=1 Tax=Edaphobacter sp. TaxID=1934404 RepID=UPI00239BEEFD|nr:metallophosphoesterase [Edaphobacter sp.]MDE1177856.1 metallophosphoesterase [Edaphobacter sp.]